jgi:hypothetical protein
MVKIVKFMNVNSHTNFVSTKVNGVVNYCMTIRQTEPPFPTVQTIIHNLPLIHQNNLSHQKKITTHKYN